MLYGVIRFVYCGSSSPDATQLSAVARVFLTESVCVSSASLTLYSETLRQFIPVDCEYLGMNPMRHVYVRTDCAAAFGLN
jgi:hypothetical protein